MSELNLLFDYQGELPECPTWDEKQQSLYWTDILAKQIHRFRLADKQHHVWSFDEEVGCFALNQSGGFIVAMRSAIWLTDSEGKLTDKICDNPSNPALARFNDGGTDATGRFYAGTFWGPQDFDGALLCRVDQNKHVKVLQCGIKGHNGLAFSPDGRFMITSDTPNGKLYRTPINENGEPGERQLWRQFFSETGVPDGGAFDTEGCYWSALYNGYKVIRISPEGEILTEIPLPVRCPTMVCFGGPQMKTLFITTTRENMQQDELQLRPLSGSIFTIETDVIGMHKPTYRDA